MGTPGAGSRRRAAAPEEVAEADSPHLEARNRHQEVGTRAEGNPPAAGSWAEGEAVEVEAGNQAADSHRPAAAPRVPQAPQGGSTPVLALRVPSAQSF